MIYPNPAQNEITVDASDASIDYQQIQITDVTGKVIFETTLNSNKMTVVDLRDFAGGIYHIHMASSSGTTVKQFIKNKLHLIQHIRAFGPFFYINDYVLLSKCNLFLVLCAQIKEIPNFVNVNILILMDKTSYIGNADPNAIDYLYKQYKNDPESVDIGWKKFFEGFEFAQTNFDSSDEIPENFQREFKVLNLINGYRTRGHLFTKTNPVRERRNIRQTSPLKTSDYLKLISILYFKLEKM